MERIRSRIDETDLKLVELLKDRCEYARVLGRIKKARNIPVRDPERESNILRRVRRISRLQKLDPRTTQEIFERIFSMSLEAQARPAGSTVSHSLSGFQVMVVGGTRGIGLFFAQLASLHGASVLIAGRSALRTAKIAREYALLPGKLQDAKKSDFVFVTAPIASTRDVCLQLGPLMKEGSLLADLSSVKTGIADYIAGALPKAVEYVSLHPLFGPDVPHIQGRSILAIPYRPGSKWRRLAKLFRDEGARVHLTTEKDHDRAMGYVQALHHFGLICLAVSLDEWNGDFVTNTLSSTLESVRRTARNWDTVLGIQQFNPFASSMRMLFKRTVNEMLDTRALSQREVANSVNHVQMWSRKQ